MDTQGIKGEAQIGEIDLLGKLPVNLAINKKFYAVVQTHQE